MYIYDVPITNANKDTINAVQSQSHNNREKPMANKIGSKTYPNTKSDKHAKTGPNSLPRLLKWSSKVSDSIGTDRCRKIVGFR